MALARGVTVAQFAVVGVMAFGDQLFPYLGVDPPALYLANRERRVGVCLGAWLLGNAAHNALTATGAFEVFYDGQLVRCGAQRHNLLIACNAAGGAMWPGLAMHMHQRPASLGGRRTVGLPQLMRAGACLAIWWQHPRETAANVWSCSQARLATGPTACSGMRRCSASWRAGACPASMRSWLPSRARGRALCRVEACCCHGVGFGLGRLHSAAGRPSMKGAREAAAELSARPEARVASGGCSLPVRVPTSLTGVCFLTTEFCTGMDKPATVCDPNGCNACCA